MSIVLSAVKDILLEQWCEGGLTPREAMEIYENSSGQRLPLEYYKFFDKLLTDWNTVGLVEFIQMEKEELGEGSGLKNSESYLDHFIKERLPFLK